MKKTAVLTALLAGMCASAFAASVSTGVQFGYSPIFENFSSTGSGKVENSGTETDSYVGETNSYGLNAYGLDGSLFLRVSDFISIPLYVQFNIGLFWEKLKYDYGEYEPEDKTKQTISVDADANCPEFSVLIGYQIPVIPVLKITPSIQFNHNLLLISLNAGAQVDYFIKGGWFVKGQFMYGFKIFHTEEETVYKKVFNENSVDLYGPTFSLGVGYRFS
jgi:hypothetical protein